MNITDIAGLMVEVLLEGIDVNQDVFDDDRKNIDYKEDQYSKSYQFRRQIMDKRVEVFLEIATYEKRCYVHFKVNGYYVKKKSSNYDVLLALKVMGYVVSCMRSIKNIHDDISVFEFTADKEHEQQYDKLLPRLSNKLGFTYEKFAWNSNRTMQDKIQKNVILSASYEIYM